MEYTEQIRARLYSVMGLCTLIDAIRHNGDEMLPFASWDSDLGNARGCLEEALVKLSALCNLPAVSGAEAVADNNAAGRISDEELRWSQFEEKDVDGRSAAVLGGSPTTFFKLPQGSANSALDQMVAIRGKADWDLVVYPEGVGWSTREQLVEAITEKRYDPDQHFTFRVFSSGAVAVGTQ